MAAADLQAAHRLPFCARLRQVGQAGPRSRGQRAAVAHAQQQARVVGGASSGCLRCRVRAQLPAAPALPLQL